MHVHCVCSGSEPEYTSDWKDFILEGQQVFSFLQRGGGQKISKAALEGTDVFSTYVFNFSNPPCDNKSHFPKYKLLKIQIQQYYPSVEITDTRHKIKLKRH